MITELENRIGKIYYNRTMEIKYGGYIQPDWDKLDYVFRLTYFMKAREFIAVAKVLLGHDKITSDKVHPVT